MDVCHTSHILYLYLTTLIASDNPSISTIRDQCDTRIHTARWFESHAAVFALVAVRGKNGAVGWELPALVDLEAAEVPLPVEEGAARVVAGGVFHLADEDGVIPRLGRLDRAAFEAGEGVGG